VSSTFSALFNRIAIKTFSDSSNFERLLSHSAYILSKIGLHFCLFVAGMILFKETRRTATRRHETVKIYFLNALFDLLCTLKRKKNHVIGSLPFVAYWIINHPVT